MWQHRVLLGKAILRRGSRVKDRLIVTRRRVLAVLGVTSAGALLAACGQQAAPTQAPAPAAKPAESKPAEAAKPTEAPKAAEAAKPTEAPKAAQAATGKPGAASGKVFWLVRSTPQENKGQE